MSQRNKPGVNEMISLPRKALQAARREELASQKTSLRYLLRQNLAIRGHAGDEGNLPQMLKFREEDTKTITLWLMEERYMSHGIINELVNLMGKEVLKTFLDSVLSQTPAWFSVMAGEATDVNHNEQMNISIRWVDNRYTISEEAVALVELTHVFWHTCNHVERCSHSL